MHLDLAHLVDFGNALSDEDGFAVEQIQRVLRSPRFEVGPLAAAHELVGGPVTVEWIEGGRHELKRKADNADVAGRIAGWLDRLRR